jgi:hypothetical protein
MLFPREREKSKQPAVENGGGSPQTKEPEHLALSVGQATTIGSVESTEKRARSDGISAVEQQCSAR